MCRHREYGCRWKAGFQESGGEDRGGGVCADLTVLKEGSALRLYEEKGKGLVALAVRRDGPVLMLSEENGKPHAMLTVRTDGPVLSLFDEKGKTRVDLGTSQTTTPGGKVITYPESSLVLFGPDGTVTWQAPR